MPASRVVLTHSCTCRPGEPLGNEAEPEFYTKEAKAVEAFRRHALERTTYWAVHFRGEHILVVSIGGRRLGCLGWLEAA